MKKLMFAMAIAATVGFAQAEDTPIGTTTTFDNLVTNTTFSTAVDQQWTNNTDTEGPVEGATVTAYDPAYDNNNYLALEGVQNLAKNINTAIGEGLYIDTMVKFSPAEEAPTPDEGDKLVVWLKETPGENDNPSTYTLMVTAGFFDSDDMGDISEVKSYPTDAVVVPDRWYNLKVKAIENVDTEGYSAEGIAGFVVLIGGTVVKTTEPTASSIDSYGETKYVDANAETYAIFPSCMKSGMVGSTTISQLAFSGSGAIDTVGAFQGDCDPDPVVQTYEVTYTGAENATVVTDPADTTALAAGATVAFTVTPAENYEYATTPSGWTAGANGAITMTYTVVAGENVVTIPAPTAKSTDVIDPASGDVAVTVTAASEDAAKTAAKALVSVPAGATVDAAVYAEYFDYSAVAGEAGKYTVSITGVKETVKAGVLEAAVERLTDDEATTIAVPAGLYYSITPSTGLPISGTAVKGLSTGGTVPVAKPGTTAGFYEVKVSATPIE